MFINENINVSESAIFMGFMRQALIESLQENNADDSSIQYIEETASDAQVLSLAMYGKSCPDDNPVFAESFLLSNLKDYMLENINDFDFSGKYSSVAFMNEIGGLSLMDTSSLSIINEGLMNDAINSAKKDYKKKSNTSIGGGPDPKEIEKDKADRQKIADMAQQTGPGVGINPKKSKKVTKELLNWEKERDEKNARAAKGNGKLAGGDNISPHGFSLMDKLHKAGENISGAWGTFTKFVNDHSGGHAKAIGVTALVGASAFLAYKAYKNYFSKAAKACKGKSGAEKDACILKARVVANKARINAFKKSMSACKATSNPSACKQKYQSKIASLQAKFS